MPGRKAPDWSPYFQLVTHTKVEKFFFLFLRNAHICRKADSRKNGSALQISHAKKEKMPLKNDSLSPDVAIKVQTGEGDV